MLLFPVLFATFYASTMAYNRETMKETLPAYAIADQVELLNVTSCRAEVERFRDAVDRRILWALRMLDASGEPGSGFTSGNNLWVGRRTLCKHLSEKKQMLVSPKALQNITLYRDPKLEYAPYELNFFIARFVHNSTQQYHIGLPEEDLGVLGICFPASCTVHELSVLVEKVFHDRILLLGQLYTADFKLVEVEDLRDDHQWLLSGKIISIILILTFLFILVIVGTVYDLLVYQKYLRKKKEFITYENNNTAELKSDLEEKGETERDGAILSDLRPETRMGQVLLCFSAHTNVKSIFQMNFGSDPITAIHGIKFLSMCWIIMAHTVFYAISVIDNKVLGYQLITSFMFQIMANTVFSVDTFFFLSGFLLTHVYLKLKKEKSATKIKENVLQFNVILIRRYLRITPPYAITILIAILNFTWYEKVSIFHHIENMHVKCSKYWWRNLLYINNLFQWDDMCLTWSWFLSNDMQFFIFGSFLLMLSSTYPRVSVVIGSFTLVASTILNGYTAYSLDYVPTMDEQYKYLTNLYEPPWLRVSPYLIGMAACVLLHNWNYKLKLSKKTLTICWCCSIACNLSILFGLVNRYIPIGLVVLYVALCKTCWALGIAWCIIACATNNGGIVNDILSFKVWLPLSRLTYSAYLLNPFIISSLVLWAEYSIRLEFLGIGVMGIGVLAVTYVCSIILTLTGEMPFNHLFRLFFNPNRRMK